MNQSRSPSRTPARFADWLGLIRFSHTIFALPFAALATVLAMTSPLSSGSTPAFRLRDILGILFCMVFARSAAMAFNRLVDQAIDAKNPRTAGRHLPAGILGRGQVWFFTLLCAAGFVGSTLLFLPNRAPLIASIPVLLFLCGYSLAKRFTSAAHLWLGVALSLSPICVWLAIRGGEVLLHPADWICPLVLASVVAAWVTGFDIIYACQDADFDSQTGLFSVPARFGIEGAFRIARASHIVMLVLLAVLLWAGRPSGLGGLFGIACLVVAGLVWRQHTLVRPGDLDRVNQAFFDTNASISVLLLVAGTIDCLWL
ncbi:prenyltransferase [Rubripirellula tenax]|uniref:4-hydroxybenzoate polyprenyltransferase n=1 Tax=Rubripirellula tenax TaxID=2528015 RepID=A0A5C6EFT8_9BACT|nr:4-hydroxybenzoate octaprenyltransferase [Rubripirellula tenax]TWU47375.1 prenyltransferase [Rubripirellula tenax]